MGQDSGSCCWVKINVGEWMKCFNELYVVVVQTGVDDVGRHLPVNYLSLPPARNDLQKTPTL